MLFNSIEFIFVFLPCVLGLTWLAVRVGLPHLVQCILLTASLVFYAWWDVSRLPLLLGTIVVNHVLAKLIWTKPSLTKPALAIGVLLNVGLLAYFKYRGFLLGDVLGLPGMSTTHATESLPLGISFFTFQQLAWLFDSARIDSAKIPLATYSLFVTFFPQLIAGPIVHHNELVPQLTSSAIGLPSPATFAAGISLFSIGLFKKVVIADYFAPVVDAAFATAGDGRILECAQAWTGLLSYACQIYYDFSGYSDMAVGLGLLFGVILPVNFASPYKARDMADFWKRWHITLSRFLREFVYIPLGGNRAGPVRQTINLVTTMVIGGLWHGAGYTFLLWGLIHGVLLSIVHLHRAAARSWPAWWPQLGPVAWALTILGILMTWVPFRASSLSATSLMYQSLLAPLGEIATACGWGDHSAISQPVSLPAIGDTALVAAAAGLLASMTLPATVEVFHDVLGEQVTSSWAAGNLVRALTWRPSGLWSAATAVLLFVAVMDLLSAAPSAFLYFQF